MLIVKHPTSLSHKLYSTDQVRKNEPEAARNAGCAMYELMERAGHAIYLRLRALMQQLPDATEHSSIVVITGNGNNAGDGFVAARLLREHHINAVVAAIDVERKLNGDAGQAQARYIEQGGPVIPVSTSLINDAAILVDCLLGTGVIREPAAAFASAIGLVNNAPAYVVSADVPSGLNATTGAPMGACIAADETICFVALKQGLVSGQAKAYVGKLRLDDLGIETHFAQCAAAEASLIGLDSFQPIVPRKAHAHKGNHGRLLCIGGNSGMSGAIRLAAEAALRSGAGLVRVFTHQESLQAVRSGRPELMVTANDLTAALQWADACVLGPGLGLDSWSQEIFNASLTHCVQHALPLLLDADALTLAAKLPEPAFPEHTIITPHPGEAARLLDTDTMHIEGERYAHARELATKYGVTSVFKGAGTIVDTGTASFVCSQGNPGMAVGGMGDVLSGIIGALLAQGAQPDLAAQLGVCLHASAGDSIAQTRGEIGILAGEVSDIIPSIVNSMGNNHRA